MEPTLGVVTETKALKAPSGRGRREDWNKLIGRTAEVWLDGRHIATGKIDQASPDDSVLWIAGDGNDTRRLYDRAAGYEIWA